jgi:hypothetical protein
MNQSHLIDSWIAELGLSSRRARRGQEPRSTHSGAGLETASPGPAAARPPSRALPPYAPRHATRGAVPQPAREYSLA